GGPAVEGVRPALLARLPQGPHPQPAADRRRGVGSGFRGQRTYPRRAHQPPPGPVRRYRVRNRHRTRPRLPARGARNPMTRWQVATRFVFALVAVLSAFTAGWLLAQLLFHFTGHPPALVAYLVAAVFGLLVGALASAVLARVTGRGDRHLLEDIRVALESIAQGNFDVHLDTGTPGPFTEVVDTVNQMAHDLGTLERQRQDFVSNVSHEIQSPLTPISGFTDLLRDPDLQAASRQRYLDIVSSECRRLSGLSDNLLRLSSLDDAHLERRPFQLEEHVRSAVLALEPVWSANEVHVELDAASVRVQADAGLLTQVWTNLVQNAVKFTPSGGRVQVRVTAQPAGAAQVQVIDSGIGIATADLPHVFERFYRADKARRSGGNGLGLALARRVIELHEGQITVT